MTRALLLLIPLAGTSTALAQPEAVFKVQTRLVEVYATIRDSHGRYMDGLTRDRFQVSDNGEVQPVVAFESNASRLSCAILIDTTGSMTAVLPVVKNSVVRLVDELRNEDEIGVFSFKFQYRIEPAARLYHGQGRCQAGGVTDAGWGSHGTV